MVREDGQEKLVGLEQRMRVVEGTHLYNLIKAIEICLVSNVVILKKFRVLEFIKYTGTQCPVTHILQQNSWGG